MSSPNKEVTNARNLIVKMLASKEYDTCKYISKNELLFNNALKSLVNPERFEFAMKKCNSYENLEKIKATLDNLMDSAKSFKGLEIKSAIAKSVEEIETLQNLQEKARSLQVSDLTISELQDSLKALCPFADQNDYFIAKFCGESNSADL